MLDRAILSKTSGEYEELRNSKKLDVMAMFFVFVKSTIGLAIFGYHEIYQKSGVWTGLILSIVYIYTVTHGCMRLVTFSDEVETKSEYQGYRTDTYFGTFTVTDRIGGDDFGRRQAPIWSYPGTSHILPQFLQYHRIHVVYFSGIL